MTIRTICFLTAVAAVVLTAPATAWAGVGQTAECPAGVVAAPAPLSGWSDRAPFEAATDDAGLSTATLELGRAADMVLKPTTEVDYPLTPARPGDAASHGGLAALTIETDGVYRVALGAGAWIDVVGSGRAVDSTRHGHGPDCSGVRKMVDFPLTRGTYVIQITGAPSSSLAIMVVAAPL